MNKRDYVILDIILKYGYLKQRELTEKSGYSLGLINSSLKKLIKAGWLTKNYESTAKTLEYLKNNKPRNAIILAAGTGMRMIPFQSTPKGLIKVNDEVLIERLIKQLHLTGIYDITIVVGYMGEKYEYLTEKYNVNIVVNTNYIKQDNLYSLSLVKDKIENTYILPCDIYFSKNPFSRTELFSFYDVLNYTEEDSFIRVSRQMQPAKIENFGNALLSFGYFNKSTSKALVQNIKSLLHKHPREKLIWEEALFCGDKSICDCYLNVARPRDAYPIKTYEDLRDIDNESESLQSKIINLITSVFNVEACDVSNVYALQKGMTNRLMRFSVFDEDYLLRIPGEGSNQLISRHTEATVYSLVKDYYISEDVIYINPVTGYKISKFINNSRIADENNFEDTKLCMQKIKSLHDLNLKTDFTFDPFTRLEYYEDLRNGPSSFADYNDVRKNVLKLQSKLNTLPSSTCLCHIDPISPNFLFDPNNKLYLIDWEYSGMADRYIDIAMFCLFAGYEEDGINRLMHQYCDGEVTDDIRLKVYSYIAICGLLWTVWSEYKALNGVIYTEYMMLQFRYARKYSKLALDLFNEREAAYEDQQTS